MEFSCVALSFPRVPCFLFPRPSILIFNVECLVLARLMELVEDSTKSDQNQG